LTAPALQKGLLREGCLERSKFRHFLQWARVSHFETRENSRIAVTDDVPPA